MQAQIFTPTSPEKIQMANPANMAASMTFHTTAEGRRPA